MKKLLLWVVLLGAPLLTEAGETVDWKKSIVSLHVDRKTYDFYQPWSSGTQNVSKFGVVVATHSILTTADALQDQTLVRAEKNGRGQLWNAEIVWIDYHANLALLTVRDEEFWKGLVATKLRDTTPITGTVHLRRWTSGVFEDWKAEINKLVIESGPLSFVACPKLSMTTEMPNGGWSEIITEGDSLVGLASNQDDNHQWAVPVHFIRWVLDARQKSSYQGLGYFPFVWQESKNPASLRALGQQGESRGVIVCEIPELPSNPSLKLHDIILEIDGFAIDSSGDYMDPDYGYLMLEYLAVRKKWAGDHISMKVLRDGKEILVDYVLPKVSFDMELLPRALYDTEPEYFVAGGLVFHPLTLPLLKCWGPKWKEDSPYNLFHFSNLNRSAETPSLVCLTQILPDSYNIGCQDYKHLVIRRIDGQAIHRLVEVQHALETPPPSGFHIIEFFNGRELNRLVLEHEGLKAATERVLEHYHLEKDRVIHTATAHF